MVQSITPGEDTFIEVPTPTTQVEESTTHAPAVVIPTTEVKAEITPIVELLNTLENNEADLMEKEAKEEVEETTTVVETPLVDEIKGKVVEEIEGK